MMSVSKKEEGSVLSGLHIKKKPSIFKALRIFNHTSITEAKQSQTA